MKRSQGSIELMIIFVIVLGVVVGFMFFLGQVTYDLDKSTQKKELDDFAESIKNEINLLQEVEFGYSRSVLIPEHIMDRFNLSVNTTGGYLIFEDNVIDGEDSERVYYYEIPIGYSAYVELMGIDHYLILIKEDIDEGQGLDLSGIPSTVNPPKPVSLLFNSNQSIVLINNKVNLSWSSSNADLCSASGDWSGAKSISGWEEVIIDSDKSFVLTCTNSSSGLNRVRTVNVLVGAIPGVVVLSFSVNDSVVSPGSLVELSWSALNADTCQASGDWGGAKLVSNTQNTIINFNSTFILNCSNSTSLSWDEEFLHVNVSTAGPLPAGTFVSVWNTSKFGDSGARTIELPLHLGGSYNFEVNWGDGNIDTITSWNDADKIHTYAVDGVYTVMMNGTIDGWSFNTAVNDCPRLVEVQQWGDVKILDGGRQFYGCENLNIVATDAPDLSSVSDASYMFYDARNVNGDLNSWNVGNIQDMSFMFTNARFSDVEISNWNTSGVQNMEYMFRNTIFNQPLNTWDVSNVQNMSGMFYMANNFNQPLNNWDTSNVVDMSYAFYHADSFNGELNNWDTSSVVDMRYMFSSADDFNQNLNNWDTSNVVNMSNMFSWTQVFNSDITTWDTSNVVDISSMFANAANFNQPIGNWDVSNVRNVFRLFYDAWSFNQPLNNWDVSGITSMEDMFFRSAFNQDLNNWDTSNVKTMESMFEQNFVFNGDISTWDVSSVENMDWMFTYASNFNSDISGWDTSSLISMLAMFEGTSFNQPIGSWDTSNVKVMGGLFAYTPFNQPIGSWDVSNVENMAFMFQSNLQFNQPIGSWDVGNVQRMEAMFAGANSFNQPIGSWDTSSVYTMTNIFKDNIIFNRDLSGWDVDQVVYCFWYDSGATSWANSNKPNFTSC